MQAINPPSNPKIKNGPRSSGCTHENPADPMHNNSSMPALLIVPCKLIDSAPANDPANALSRFNIGFDVSISALTLHDPAAYSKSESPAGALGGWRPQERDLFPKTVQQLLLVTVAASHLQSAAWVSAVPHICYTSPIV